MITGRDILLTEKKGHIYIMTINRKERRNALSNELFDRMAEEWERFEEDDDLWVAIFTGAGDVAFSAGHDIKEDIEGDVRGGARGSIKPVPRRQPHPEMLTRKPTIAAINGYCLAAGWLMAMRCDVRIAAEHAEFAIPEVTWNLSGGFGAQLEYVATIGIACEILMWGRRLSAQRAYEIGFVNKVVPKERLMPECMEWAEYMCTLGQPAVRAHKELIYRGRYMSGSDLHALEKDLFPWFWYPERLKIDAKAGPGEFTEGKRGK